MTQQTYVKRLCVVAALIREMVASLKICAAVHGTVDDNMAVHGAVDRNNGEEDGRLERTAPFTGYCWTPVVVVHHRIVTIGSSEASDLGSIDSVDSIAATNTVLLVCVTRDL